MALATRQGLLPLGVLVAVHAEAQGVVLLCFMGALRRFRLAAIRMVAIVAHALGVMLLFGVLAIGNDLFALGLRVYLTWCLFSLMAEILRLAFDFFNGLNLLQRGLRVGGLKALGRSFGLG